jgi:hypothetical protein
MVQVIWWSARVTAAIAAAGAWSHRSFTVVDGMGPSTPRYTQADLAARQFSRADSSAA